MQHLLIKTKGSKERFTKTNDIRIDQEVQHAFKNFHKLRWINLKEDDFTNLPEFQRITRKFADYINHIDEWLKKNKHEEISSYLQSVYHWYHTPSKE